MKRDEQFRSRIERLIHDADVGIDGLAVEKDTQFEIDGRRKSLSHLFSTIAENVVFAKTASYLPTDIDVGDVLAIRTLHRIPNSDETVALSLDGEGSNGTLRFLGVIGPFLDALDRGDLLVVDELDCSMHPHLTYKLVEMFQSAEANPKGAQLIFATHDTNLMTPSLFRRDEIWLTEKTAGGATELYSLADIKSKARKDDSFEKHYLAGRYGGVPSFGPALEGF
jgi:AAA15 family ATPase/GTPase